MKANERRFGEFHEELKKGVFGGRDEYPETVSEAYQLLLRTSRQIGYQSNRRVTSNHFRGNLSNRNFMLVQIPTSLKMSLLLFLEMMEYFTRKLCVTRAELRVIMLETVLT